MEPLGRQQWSGRDYPREVSSNAASRKKLAISMSIHSWLVVQHMASVLWVRSYQHV